MPGDQKKGLETLDSFAADVSDDRTVKQSIHPSFFAQCSDTLLRSMVVAVAEGAQAQGCIVERDTWTRSFFAKLKAGKQSRQEMLRFLEKKNLKLVAGTKDKTDTHAAARHD